MKNGKNGRRILSVLLAAIMLISTISVGLFAFAEDGQQEPAKTINYVAIGDDEAAGINTRVDGKKSYPELIVENYENKGYKVNYTNYSQLYFGSNEIREHLALDDYKIPEKFQQGNNFIEWEYIKKSSFSGKKNFHWTKDGKQPAAADAIKNANVITLNMGTNDFAYYTLFRVLDMMQFQMPAYPSSLFGMLGFANKVTAEVDKNARIQQIMNTVSEIKAFKQKADLEAALLSLQFVAPESIQLDDELETAEMQVAAVEAMIPTVTTMFKFEDLSGHENLEKQKAEIERYKGYKANMAKKAEAEKALADLSYTEPGSILDAKARQAAEREVEKVKSAIEDVQDFMEPSKLKGYDRLALQEKEIESFTAKQVQIEKKVFADLIAGLTFTSVDRIHSIEDLGVAATQVADVKKAIANFEKIDVTAEPGYEKIALQEAAIEQWKEANKDAVEAEKKKQEAYNNVVSTLKNLKWSKAGEEIPVYSTGWWSKKYYYDKNWNEAKAEIKKTEEAMASYKEAYGEADFDTTPLENLKANLREYGKKYRDELKKLGIEVDENGEEVVVPATESVSAPKVRTRRSLFALNANDEAKLAEAEQAEDEAKQAEEDQKQLEADIRAAESALSKLTYTEGGSVRDEKALAAASKQYEEAAAALAKIPDDKKADLKGYENFKAQGMVIEHYKNGEWHKNAEKIQNENLAYSYRQTALVANAVGLGKDMVYMFASASKDVSRNYIRNYKAILTTINELNPNAEVVVVGLHNPLENIAPGDISSYVGKAVDAVNTALYDKTGYKFDVGTVFYDGGIGSLAKQGVSMVVSKIRNKVTSVFTKIRTTINNVITNIRNTIAGIFNKNKGNNTNKPSETTPEETEDTKDLAAEHREAEEKAEAAAAEACSRLTYIEPDSITNKSDLEVAKAQYVAANEAVEKVLESRRSKVAGVENIQKQRKAMDRFRYGSLDNKKPGKYLTPVISKTNDYLKVSGTEAGIANFHYIDTSKVNPEMPSVELAPIIDFVTSLDIEAIKKKPTSALGLLGPLDNILKPDFGVGVQDLMWKYNTRNPLFPTAKGHEQIYDAFLTSVGESSYTKKNVSFGDRIKSSIFEALFT